MIKTALERLPDQTIRMTISIPWGVVAETYDQVVADTVKNAELSGFRKGKAPKSLVEKSLDKTKIYEEVIRQILPKVYSEAVKDQKLHPIIVPKIELLEATEKKDWVIRASTCEQPDVELNDYQEKVKALKKSKLTKIWVPGEKQDKEEDKKTQKPSLDEILSAVYTAVKIKIPKLLSDQEVNRLLSDLIDQTKKLGLTVEQYLASTGRTAETIRQEYEKLADRTLVLEFTLEAIADKEGIIVSDDDIDKAINSAKDESEKKALSGQRYYIASILRRQKTLDFLNLL